MSLFIVSYDLVKEKIGFDYGPLSKALTAIGGLKTQFSVWLVENSGTQRSIYKQLKPFIDSDDRLMVVEITKRPNWNTGFQGTNALIDRLFPS